MIFDWLKRKQAPEATHATAIPAGGVVYAVGDVHGRLDLFERMAARIGEDCARSRPEWALTVFLGDYVDRGPGSRAVVERLSTGDFPTAVVALRGNHEEIFLGALASAEALAPWRDLGGFETMHSYGVDVRALLAGGDPAATWASFAASVPAAHVAWMEGLPDRYELGDYFFCHAGVRPGVPLAQQERHDLLWIRDAFRSSGAWHGKVIVHGHTPVENPEILPNRVNIDTGAYITGVLTCLRLEGGARTLITVR